MAALPHDDLPPFPFLEYADRFGTLNLHVDPRIVASPCDDGPIRLIIPQPLPRPSDDLPTGPPLDDDLSVEDLDREIAAVIDKNAELYRRLAR